MLVETDCFIIDLPESWSVEQDEESLIFNDPDNITCLEISAVRKQDGLVEDDDLKIFSQDFLEQGLKPTPISIGDFCGSYFSLEEDGEAWREWVLCAEDVMLLASHGAELEDKGLDDAIVDEMLSTLLVLKKAEEAE